MCKRGLMRNFVDKWKRYGWFSYVERSQFMLGVLALALIYSWDNWGGTQFDLVFGLKNFARAFILVAITLYVHHASQRVMALRNGLKAEQQLWWYGIIIGLMLAIVSNGGIKLLAVSSTLAFILPVHRLGAFRYGPNMSVIAKICLAGPLGNVLLASVVALVDMFAASPLLRELFVLNLVFAWWNMLPIPPLDGAKVLFWSRSVYVLLFAGLSAYLALLLWFGFSSILLSFAVAVGIAVFFSNKGWV